MELIAKMFEIFLARLSSRRRSSLLKQVVVELEAWLEEKDQARLLIILRNQSNQTCLAAKFMIGKPKGAIFIKDHKDEYRDHILGVHHYISPKDDKMKSQHKRAFGVTLQLPQARAVPNQNIVVYIRCDFAAAASQSGWIKSATNLQLPKHDL